MRRFFFKTLYLLPFLVSLFYVEYKLTKIPNSFSFKREHLEKQLDSIEVLILGSSQIARDINPAFLTKKAYNLADVSQSLFYDSRLTMKYIDRMPKLKYVIISVSYFSLGYQIADGIEPWRDYFYSQFWGINYYDLNKFDIKCYSKLYLYTPKISWLYFKKNWDVNLTGNYFENGFLFDGIKRNETTISDSLGYERVKVHNSLYKEERCAKNQEDLDGLIQQLKKRNITPIIITPPVYSTYYKFAKNDIINKNTKFINQLCSKYNCKYFNYYKDTSFSKEEFLDNDHLNFEGARKFSRSINNIILN